MNIHSFTRPTLRRIRAKRMQRFCRLMDVRPDTNVLDVGGNTFNWDMAPVLPRVTFLNLDVERFAIPEAAAVQYTLTVGRGEALPFRDRSFEVVFCNSVIEHLGTWENQVHMAAELRRVGRRLFVQTPNSHFLFEPHYVTPAIHFVPPQLRRRLARNFTVWGWLMRPSQAEIDALIAELRLLDSREMRALFPDARIEVERVLGAGKSLIAVR